MQTNELLDRWEQGRSAGQLPADPNFSRLYMERVLSHYGADNAALLHLGKHWHAVARKASEPAYAYRVGGIYERARGKWLTSAKAFDAAGELAETSPEKWSFRIGAIDSFARAGRLDDTVRLAESVVAGLRSAGEFGQAARALLNLGNALVYQDQMAQARTVLEQALPDLESNGFHLEAASCRLALSSTHLFGGDPKLAMSLAREVADVSTGYLQDLARLNVALALTVTGLPDQALEILFALRSTLETSVVDAARVHEYLGDAYYRLNLWPEAIESYEAALADGEATPLHRANLQLGLGYALLASGGDAEPRFLAAARLYRKIKNPVWEGASLLGIVKANPAAQRNLKKALELTKDSPFYQCECLLELAEREDGYLDEAESLINRHGYQSIAWRVPYLRAKNASQPERHYRSMFKLILASRLATTSLVSRMSFLRDKSDAIRAYLDHLLGKPTQRNIEEAVSVIEQSRAVTLLEEFATRSELPPGFVEKIEALREALALPEEAPRGARRHLPISTSGLGRIAAETIRRVENALPQLGDAEPSAVLFESSQSIHILRKGQSIRVEATSAEMERNLKWLAFELLAPMAEPDAHEREAEALLCKVGSVFKDIWALPENRICPDGSLWRVPWAAASIAFGQPKEMHLTLHPRMGGCFRGGLTQESSVLILLGRSSDLPFAEKEAEEIARLFPKHRLVSTVKEAQEALQGSYDAVHVISHAIHRPENPMFSSIEFEDGPLFATEVARSGLRTRLATLSACETGTMSLAMREEPDGLARAFLARGAESVIASQWPLNDEAAFRQFLSIYRELLSGAGAEKALFRARCICRQWKRHPYYWGALALYAGYGR